MSDDKNDKSQPPPGDSTSSVVSSAQDKINKRILAQRLKKEQETEARKSRAQDKDKQPKHRPSADPSKSKHVSLPTIIPNWNVPFSASKPLAPDKPPVQRRRTSEVKLPEIQPPVQIQILETNNDQSEAVSPTVGNKFRQAETPWDNKVKAPTENSKNKLQPKGGKTEIKTGNPKSILGILKGLYHKAPPPTAPTCDDNAFESPDATPSLALMSKPGSRNFVKAISFQTPTNFDGDDKSFRPSRADNDSKVDHFENRASFQGYPEYYRHSDRPLAITRGNFEKEIQDERLVSDRKNDRNKVDESLINVLKCGKDEATHVTIIPADEAKILQIEMKHWRFHRIAFLILFVLAMIMGLVIVAFTLYSSVNYFLVKAATYDDEIREAAQNFILHTDSMIIGCVFINAVGILIFRLLPQVKKRTVVRIHVLIVTFTSLLFAFSFAVAFYTHKDVTGRPEHLYSLHGLVGTIIGIFLVIEVLTGLYVLYRPGGYYVTFHAALGMMTFMASGACCISGYLGRALLFGGAKIQGADKKNLMTNVTGVLIIVFCCLVRYIGADFRFRRRSQPEWDTVFSRSLTSLEDYNIDRAGCSLQEYVRRNVVPKKK